MNAHIYAIYTPYIAHTAHLSLHAFCIYSEVLNQSITDYLYKLHTSYMHN